ncbi:MAG: 2-dehydropantoate 2-reductase [Candidatus Latescibacteria bacterium]|jgi:2-dehydropantoate 2-reductase|nr:2-dehydropantoate 2-reductase [Candidatus Latescibacterota bacterium]
MRIAIFGVGAVGGYLGASLIRNGEEVAFIARGDHLSAIRANGLSVDDTDQEYSVHPTIATESPVEVGPVDTVIVGVKAWQVVEAAQALGPMLGPDTTVLSVQNGVEAPRDLAGVLGSDRVLASTVGVFSSIVEPARLRKKGGCHMQIGELDRAASERVLELVAVLADCGVTATAADDIQVELWRKLTMIAALSGVGSLVRLPVGDWRHLPETRALHVRVVDEGAAVAHAEGSEVSSEALEQIKTAVDRYAAETTASMQRDIMEGRPSELEHLTGAIVRHGRKNGVATPVHSVIYGCLLPVERCARREAAM